MGDLGVESAHPAGTPAAGRPRLRPDPRVMVSPKGSSPRPVLVPWSKATDERTRGKRKRPLGGKRKGAAFGYARRKA